MEGDWFMQLVIWFMKYYQTTLLYFKMQQKLDFPDQFQIMTFVVLYVMYAIDIAPPREAEGEPAPLYPTTLGLTAPSGKAHCVGSAKGRKSYV